MSNPKIYIDREGIVKYIEDCPVEPDYCTEVSMPCDRGNSLGIIHGTCDCIKEATQFHEALSKAKEQAVMFAEQDMVKYLVSQPMGKSLYLLTTKADTLYDLPSGVEVEVTYPDCEQCGFTYRPECNGLCKLTKSLREKASKITPLAYIDEPPALKQEEMWREAMHHAGSQIDPIKWLSEKYRLIRR
jgi:hypothetical protein